MASELRWCKSCDQTTPHDSFVDGLAQGQKSSAGERLFFGVVTFGFSEAIADRWNKCQRCGRKERE